MAFRMITEGEWRRLQDSGGQHDRIRARVSRIIGWLAMLFNGNSPGGVVGLTFNAETEGDVICHVATPVGSGRIRLDWTLIEGQLHGLLLVEKGTTDELEQRRWLRVWELKVPETSNVFVAQPSDGYAVRQSSGTQLEHDIFALGMSIYFSIVSGPVTE